MQPKTIIMSIAALAAANFPQPSSAAGVFPGIQGLDGAAYVVFRLSLKARELDALRDKASEVSKKIGSLATDGSLPTNDEGVRLLQQFLDELRQTNAALKKVQEDVNGILAWIDTQKTTVQSAKADIANLKRVAASNYVQFQWQTTDPDSNQTRNNGFQVRRFMFGQTNRIDDKTSMRLSFDVATGTNRLAAELKDAILVYDVVPPSQPMATVVSAGQQPMPLGYELERSSSKREFPEFAIYNTTLFNGERDRGVMIRRGIGHGIFLHAGAWNGLTVNDPQQNAIGFRDIDNKVAGTFGIRAVGDRYEVGISTLQGRRSGFVPVVNPAQVVPETQRSLVYLDASYSGLAIDALSVRGEVMFGKDRPPTGGINNPTYRRQTDVLGWQTQLNYALNRADSLHVRFQYFDPDTTGSVGDSQSSWGYAFTHWFNPGVKVTLSYETFGETPSQRNNVVTIRTQFKL